MFGKKCSKCRGDIEKNFLYCPYCGKKTREADGLLDEIDNFNFGFPVNFGFSSAMLSKLFKEMDKQMHGLDWDIAKENKRDTGKIGNEISISINMAGGTPKIRINDLEKEKNIPIVKRSNKNFEKFSNLPKEEAKSIVKRLSDKIVYEVNIPGVESIKDIAINQLQNSIEIKAFTKNKVFFKLIPISLPLSKYYLKEGKLFLELEPQN